jgi:hypothetical protein
MRLPLCFFLLFDNGGRHGTAAPTWLIIMINAAELPHTTNVPEKTPAWNAIPFGAEGQEDARRHE